jgi:hypothetical protein
VSDAAIEVEGAVKDSSAALVRAIGLLSIEIKPGMDRNSETLEEVRDLIIEVQRDLCGIKGYLEDAGLLRAQRGGAEGNA